MARGGKTKVAKTTRVRDVNTSQPHPTRVRDGCTTQPPPSLQAPTLPPPSLQTPTLPPPSLQTPTLPPPSQPAQSQSASTQQPPSQPAPSQPAPSQPASSHEPHFQSTSSQQPHSHRAPTLPGVVIPMEINFDAQDSPNGTPSPSSRASTSEAATVRPVVCIYKNRLFPENTSSEISKIFQKRVFPTGYNWKRVPPNEKKEYFKEFGKAFTWAEEDEIPIRNLFMKQAAARYRDMVSHWKADWYKHKKIPGCIPQERWESWLAYWNEPKTIVKSQKNSRNRMTKVEEGKGPSKHTCGSKSTVGHMIAMQQERGGVMPSLFEVQKRTHTRKDGTFVDERSKKVCEEVERRIAESAIDGDASSVDQDKIYLDVVGGVKKQRVYGLGSFGCSLVRDGQVSSQTSSSSIDALIMERMEAERAGYNQRHEELLRKLEEERELREQKIKEMEEDKQKMQDKLEQENERMKILLESQGNQLKALLDSLARHGFTL